MNANLPGSIKIDEYDYPLAPEKISQFPLSVRDESKLLIYENGQISQDIFKNIPQYLNDNSLIFFNDTKVIRARLIFEKSTGAKIEVFCLEPIHPTREMETAFQQQSGVTWKCLVGNSKKWKSGVLTTFFECSGKKCMLSAERLSSEDGYSLIKLSWTPALNLFSEVLTAYGRVPLPPYIKREAVDTDNERYQTVYAQQDGSVAAPTAGLHFTPDVLKNLRKRNIKPFFLTLHVGAGTFTPVSTPTVDQHNMHIESVSITRNVVEELFKDSPRMKIAVGTTTVRTLESLYWYGVKLMVDPHTTGEMKIDQWDPYKSTFDKNISVKDSMNAVLRFMDKHHLDEIHGNTRLMIVPGYKYRIPDIIITNFHQPKSTLLLLVSAFIGGNWKKVYKYALENNFRFLSYGDSCLFYKNKDQ